MRTTVNLDEDVLRSARAIARQRGQSLGTVLSELARRGLKPAAPIAYRDDFPVFEVAEDAPVFGEDEVAAALDEE